MRCNHQLSRIVRRGLLLVPLLALLVLTGCSRTELAYRHADWLLQRWAGDLLDADARQRDAWQALLQQAMDGHRRDLLPTVVALLEDAEEAAGNGLNATELSCWADALDRAYRRHAAWAVPAAVGILADISPDQVEHLAAELAQRNRDYRRRYLADDPVERREARIERYIERIEDWTGDLSTMQLRLVGQAVGAMPDLAEDWLAYREGRQQALLELLRGGADRETLGRFLADWWIDLGGRPAAMQTRTAELRQATIGLILALDGTVSERQRAAFVGRLSALHEDLAGIAGEDGTLPVRAAPLLCAEVEPTRVN
jgi:hypothetical protein